MTVSTARPARWIALLLLVVGIGLMLIGPAEQPVSATGTQPDHADSTAVALLQQQQEGDASGTAVALFLFDDSVDMQYLGSQAEELEGPPIPSDDGQAALVPFTLDSEGLTDNRDKINYLREQLQSDAPEGVTVQLTGPAAINADLSNVFDGASFLLLGVTAIIVAVLLVFTYRSPILWIIPLLVIGVADRVAAVTVTWFLDTVGAVWDESTLGILSVLVFGAGTNYALLLISRYREELTRHEDRFAAMAAAWGPIAKTVSLSAGTVALGVVCLVISLIPTTRGLGLAAAFGVMIALIFALFCLPGLLVLFGRWIFWPKQPEYGNRVEHKLWDRIGDKVREYPTVIGIASFAALLVACIGALQIQTGLSQSDQFINTPESITAAEALGDYFPDSSATPVILATRNPGEAVGRLESDGMTVQAQEPAGGYEMFQVSGGLANEGAEATPELRALLDGTDSLIGGQDAQLYDTEQAAERDRMLIFPLVLLLIFVALVLVLRAIVGPLIMVASVLLTNIAALGLGWWVSTGVFGFDTFDSTTPLYAFVFLVALGIDYTIFLITRTKDEALTHGTKEGVLKALSYTGGVITSAGILLAAVFAALGVLPLVVLAQIGIVICIGVLLDTLIVRTLLVPSVVQLLGERFWWPGKAQRVDS